MRLKKMKQNALRWKYLNWGCVVDYLRGQLVMHAGYLSSIPSLPIFEGQTIFSMYTTYFTLYLPGTKTGIFRKNLHTNKLKSDGKEP